MWEFLWFYIFYQLTSSIRSHLRRGALAVKEATFMNMNGFSNLYFGWVSEDDDVGIR